MSRIDIGNERMVCNCCTDRTYIFNEEVTVQEFIDEITDKEHKVDLAVYSERNTWMEYFRDCIKKDGKVVTVIPDTIANARVFRAHSCGGYGNTQYDLWI